MTPANGEEHEQLLLRELSDRSRLNALVHERKHALAEAERLHVKATRPGGDPRLDAEADRWRAVAERVAGEIEAAHAQLRDSQAALAAVKARRAAGL